MQIDGEPWFILADAGSILGLDRSGLSGNVKRWADAAEVKTVRKRDTLPQFEVVWAGTRASQLTLVSESGLYKLILSYGRKLVTLDQAAV